ncbi:GNAT family acetyltransferase [Chelativorans sp. SCAU2101]|uniref:GNAT family acetyltransferase n=1 Tax=Chelativorans petroleitrophicus TaxID=2975484 RepID=A0A9X2X6J4_9HYPH|nr:GNAT family acetyltransferase [Chelativorans petroleitrophicus]MCT8989081.1 GNAT family acetyltransferase [Chelativorans petroleitrophicus]
MRRGISMPGEQWVGESVLASAAMGWRTIRCIACRKYRFARTRTMKKLYETAAFAYFLIATVSLLISAFVLMGYALWEIAGGILATDLNSVNRVRSALDGVGLMIIGFAVVEAGTFIAEEELIRKRELRSTRESRRSITKFITIIVIAASLEALVMVFKTGREAIPAVIYPAALFASAMLALVALGAYQWLSSSVERGGDDFPQPPA